MDIPIDRPTAIALGVKYYNGNECKHCKTTVKRVRQYDCLECHRGRTRRYAKEYKKTPKGRASWKSHKRLYKAQKTSAYPAWADRQKITQIYEDARLTGMHVDHIIPLKHPLVCGLHCEFNLQLLDPQTNINKSNRFSVG
jgi:hypothetical protein